MSGGRFGPQSGDVALTRYLQVLHHIEPDLTGGLCAGADPSMFFPEGTAAEVKANYKLAQQICAMCRIRRECGDAAVQRNEVFGVWGGMTPTERLRIRQRGRAA